MDSENIKKSILNNNLPLVIARIAPPLFSWILVVSIARLTGKAGLGSYYFVVEFFAMFSAFSVLGLGNLVIREVTRDKENLNKYVINLGIIGLLSTVFFMLIMYGIVFIFGYSADIKQAVYIVGIFLFPFFVLQICESIFIALGKTKYVMCGVIIGNGLRVVVSLMALMRGYGLIPLVVIFALSICCTAGFYVYELLKLVDTIFVGIDKALWRRVFKLIPAFFSIGFLGSLLFQMPNIVLLRVGGEESLGLYTAAYKFVFMWSVVSGASLSVVLPILSKLFVDSRDQFNRISTKLMTYTVLFIAPCILVIIIIAKTIILFFFGEQFIGSVNALYLLSAMLFLITGTGLLGFILTASNHQKSDLAAIAIGLSVAIFLHPLLAYYFSYMGTCVATLMSFLVLMIFQVYFIRRQLFSFNPVAMFYKPVILTLISVCVVFLCRGLPSFLTAFLVLLIYFGGALLLKAIHINDLVLLWESYRPRMKYK